MPALTRRRGPEAREERWHIYFGDVRIGTIAMKTGAPSDVDQWGWVCGFYPGSHPGEQMAGSAPNFEQARADFEDAWRIFSARRTEADYQAWRDDRDWTRWKYAMWDAGMKMPTQSRTALRVASAEQRSRSPAWRATSGQHTGCQLEKIHRTSRLCRPGNRRAQADGDR
jgi:hypothetical protein